MPNVTPIFAKTGRHLPPSNCTLYGYDAYALLRRRRVGLTSVQWKLREVLTPESLGWWEKKML